MNKMRTTTGHCRVEGLMMTVFMCAGNCSVDYFTSHARDVDTAPKPLRDDVTMSLRDRITAQVVQGRNPGATLGTDRTRNAPRSDSAGSFGLCGLRVLHRVFCTGSTGF